MSSTLQSSDNTSGKKKQTLIEKVKQCLSLPEDQMWPDEDIWEYLKKYNYKPQEAAEAIIQVPETKRPRQWTSSKKAKKPQSQVVVPPVTASPSTSVKAPTEGNDNGVQRRENDNSNVNSNIRDKRVAVSNTRDMQNDKNKPVINSKGSGQKPVYSNRPPPVNATPPNFTVNKPQGGVNKTSTSANPKPPKSGHVEQKKIEPTSASSTVAATKSPPLQPEKIPTIQPSTETVITPSISSLNHSDQVDSSKSQNPSIDTESELNSKSRPQNKNRKGGGNDFRGARGKQKVWKVKEQQEESQTKDVISPVPHRIVEPPIEHVSVPQEVKTSSKNRAGVVILASFLDDATDYDVDFGEPEPSQVTDNTQNTSIPPVPPVIEEKTEIPVEQIEVAPLSSTPPHDSPITTTNQLSAVPVHNERRAPNPVPAQRLPTQNSPPNVDQLPMPPFIPAQYQNVYVTPQHHLMYSPMESLPGFYDQYMHPPYGHHGLMSSDGASHMPVSQSHLSNDPSLNIRDADSQTGSAYNNSHDTQEDTSPPSVPPNPVNLQGMSTVAPGIGQFGMPSSGVMPVVGQQINSQHHQTSTHAHPYASQAGMYPYYPQAAYSASQPNPASMVPMLPRYMLPPKHSFPNQPQYGPNPAQMTYHDDGEGFAHKPGMAGNHPGYMMPFPQVSPVEQGPRGHTRNPRYPYNKGPSVTGLLKPSDAGVQQNSNASGQGQPNSMTNKGVHEQIQEGAHPGSMMHPQVGQRKMNRNQFPEDFHSQAMDPYYLQGQQAPPMPFLYPPHPVHVPPMHPFGSRNPVTLIQRHHEQRGQRDGDNQSQ